MDQNKRRTPAIPDRRYDESYQSRFGRPPIPPPAPANPGISFRYGRGVLESLQAFVAPIYQRFPFFQETIAPANPVIPVRYGRDALQGPEAFVSPQYQRFPYFEQPANPPVYFRYGRDVLPDVQAFVEPRYFPFPYFQEAPAAANPVIPYIRGQWLGDQERTAYAYPHFTDGRFFEAAAHTVIEFRYGRALPGEERAFVIGRYQQFPYFPAVVAPANPVIGFRYGRDMLLGPSAFIEPRYHRFPYPSSGAVEEALVPFLIGDDLGGSIYMIGE